MQHETRPCRALAHARPEHAANAVAVANDLANVHAFAHACAHASATANANANANACANAPANACASADVRSLEAIRPDAPRPGCGAVRSRSVCTPDATATASANASATANAIAIATATGHAIAFADAIANAVANANGFANANANAIAIAIGGLIMVQAWDFVDSAILWGTRASVMSKRIDEIDWGLRVGVRIVNACKYDRIHVVADLVRHTEAEMMRCPNLGRKSVDTIKAELSKHGLKLGREGSWT